MRLKVFIFLFLISLIVNSQQNFEEIKLKMDSLSNKNKGLNDIVQINVTNITLYDFLIAIGNEHKINISVDQLLDQKIINNFYNIKVKNVLLFIIKKYKLNTEIYDGIINIGKSKDKNEEKRIKVEYNKEKKTLTVDLKQDELFLVAKEITTKTSKNIIVSPKLKKVKVSSYILNKDLKSCLTMIAESNDLTIKEGTGYYEFTERLKEENRITEKKNKAIKLNRKPQNLSITINPNGTLNVSSNEASLIDVIFHLAKKSNNNYFFYSKISDNLKTTFSVKGMKFDDILLHLLKGTNFTFKKEDGYFLIGEKSKEGIRTTEVIKMKNRTIENVATTVPSKILTDIEIKEFKELNALVISGHASAVKEVKNFLQKIDKSVPVIQIEVIIFQYEKSYEIQTGLRAGFDKEQKSSLITAFPTSDIKLNSNKLNKLISAFNGLGIINLGKVPTNFYMALQALENNAIIKLESTPKIATLNGHEANFKIGATDYYFEQTNRLITGGVRDDVLQSGQWRPTEANLSLKIKPYVSKDESVTLSIEVEKSAFTGRVGETAPPSKSTQQFESLIRVKNGEMILLGGLDEVENNNSGTGTPFLSRIPIIKWFFSGRKKKKAKKKLHMFIKPTVFYQ